jgi:hypothetical protein
VDAGGVEEEVVAPMAADPGAAAGRLEARAVDAVTTLSVPVDEFR